MPKLFRGEAMGVVLLSCLGLVFAGCSDKDDEDNPDSDGVDAEAAQKLLKKK